jgi:hypothetical protein
VTGAGGHFRTAADGKILIQDNIAVAAGAIAIPEDVTGLGASLFSSNIKITSVILPSTLTVIPASAFEDCVLLELVTLPEMLQTIGSSAFNGCTKLQFTFARIPYINRIFRIFLLQSEFNHHSSGNNLIFTSRN